MIRRPSCPPRAMVSGATSNEHSPSKHSPDVYDLSPGAIEPHRSDQGHVPPSGHPIRPSSRRLAIVDSDGPRREVNERGFPRAEGGSSRV